MGVAVAKEALQRANVSPDQINDSIWGCARQAGGGPNVARQITFRAGVPETVPAFTVNQACGSGLKAIILAAQEIMLGRAEAVLAGGTESMSRVPYLQSLRKIANADAVEGNERSPYHDKFALDRIEQALKEQNAASGTQPRLPRAERGENMLYAAQVNSKALQRVTQYIPAQIPKERLRAIPWAALCVQCKSGGLSRR